MVEVRECDGEPDEQISLEVYNTVWPHDAIAMAEVRSFKASVAARWGARWVSSSRSGPTGSSRS